MSAPAIWHCRFCGGSGPDPWLGTHACPDVPSSNAITDYFLLASSVSSLRMKILDAQYRRGGVTLSKRHAERLLDAIENYAAAARVSPPLAPAAPSGQEPR